MVVDTTTHSLFNPIWLALRGWLQTRLVLGTLRASAVLLTSRIRFWRSQHLGPLFRSACSSRADRFLGFGTRSWYWPHRCLLQVRASAPSALVALALLATTGCADLVSPIGPGDTTQADNGDIDRVHQPSLPSANSCFVSSLSDIAFDADRDGLFDSCEYQLAQRFRPSLTINDDDPSSLARSRYTFWAAAPSNRWTPQTVTIFYALGYYEDLGDGIVSTSSISAHQGDSEYITVNLINSRSRGWIATSTCGSHHGSLSCQLGSNWWVAEKKHANYASQQLCNSGGIAGSDNCANNDAPSDVSVRSDANLGSAHRMLLNCVSTPAQWRNGTECFWTGSSFCGWTSRTGDPCATPYSTHLAHRLPNLGWTQRPVARASITCSGTNCTLDASASSDDMRVASYHWHIHTFEEGRDTRSSGQEIIWTDTSPVRRHNFVGLDRLKVILTVRDDYHLASSRTTIVHLN